MPISELILRHGLPFTAVLARMAGLFIFAPAIGSASVPMRIKALLTMLMALAVYPTLDLSNQIIPAGDALSLVPLLTGEAIVGMAIGLIASLPIISVQIGGLLMGQQMGLGIASIFNPALDTQGDILGQILLFMALSLFLMMNGLETLHMTLVESFANVPLGGVAMSQAPLELVVGAITAGYELAARVAAPVLVILFLETVATGFLMKTVPQLNILSFGFPLKILLGLLALTASIGAVVDVTGVQIEQSLAVISQWVRSL